VIAERGQVVRAWSKCSKTNAAATIVPIRGSWDAAWPACSQGDPRRAPSSQGNRPLATDRLRQRISNLGLRNICPRATAHLPHSHRRYPPHCSPIRSALSLSAASIWSKTTGAVRGEYVGLRNDDWRPTLGRAGPTRRDDIRARVEKLFSDLTTGNAAD
jgi:hypothetical protein